MWVLLLRAVNLGPTNKLAMKDLKALLEDLGHTHVTTFLNSGNATFASRRRSAKAIADEVEKELSRRHGLDVRACVRTGHQIESALDELPELPGYVVVGVLFDTPEPAALEAFLATDWGPDRVEGNDQVLYLGYADGVHSSRTTTARIERALGVGCTARTPASLRKMVGRAAS